MFSGSKRSLHTLIVFCCILSYSDFGYFHPYPSGLLHWNWTIKKIASFSMMHEKYRQPNYMANKLFLCNHKYEIYKHIDKISSNSKR